MITKTTAWFHKDRHHENASRRCVSRFKGRRLTIECVENRLLLAIDLTAGMPLQIAHIEASPYIDISSVANGQARIYDSIHPDTAGIALSTNGTFGNAVCDLTAFCNNSSVDRQFLIRIDAGTFPEPSKSPMIDIGTIAGANNPNNQQTIPTVSREPTSIAGPIYVPADASKSPTPISVEGVRGRSQVLEVAQSTYRESKSNAVIRSENIIGEKPQLETVVCIARLSSESITAGPSVSFSKVENNAENNSQPTFTRFSLSRTTEAEETRTASSIAGRSVAASPKQQTVVVRTASIAYQTESSRSIHDSRQYDTPTTRKASDKAAVPTDATAHQEFDKQLLQQVACTDTGKRSTESKPLSIATEESQHSRVVGFAIAAVAGQLAIPGWRRFFSKSKTQLIPPRRRDSIS
jgi:hypothetical protein